MPMSEQAVAPGGRISHPDPGSEHLLRVCRELATRFEVRADEYDRQGAFPAADFAELRASGLYGLMVPVSHGGYGANFEVYTQAIELLAMGDASTALAFNMHSVVVGSLAELDMQDVPGRRARSIEACRNWIYDQANAGCLFASASSEPEAGPRLSCIQTTYERVPDGFRINGVKSFVSMAGHADYYLVAARSQQNFGAVPGISYFIIERDNPQIRFSDSWDVLGMRSTCSNTMTLENCFVPMERLFLLEGVALYKSTREPHWLVGAYNGVYLGIAAAVCEFVVRYLKNKRRGDGPSIISDPLVQLRVGELFLQLESIRAMTYDAARLVTKSRGSIEANTAIHRAKYMVGEVGPWIASQAMRLCGGSTISRRFPLERYYRDSRCGGLMPARSDDCLIYLGKAALGLDVSDPLQSYW